LDWERGRITDPPRVAILLMGFGCACWNSGCSGAPATGCRAASRPRRAQLRRRNVIKRGWEVLQAARKRRSIPLIPPPMPRVLDYQCRFLGSRLPCGAAWVELWQLEQMCHAI